MRRAAGEGLDALFLIHIEGGAHERFIIIVFHIEQATLGIQELAYVAREIHHGAVLQRSDSHLFDIFHRQIDVRPVLPIVAMTVVIYFIALVVLARGIVHNHHIIGQQILVAILLEE